MIIKNLDEKYLKLYNEALKAYENSYSPYSNFKVGASLLTKDGNIFIGTNVENRSFGLTNCAERSSLFNAYSNGYRKDDIEVLLIVGNTDKPISPCGACRQVINELMNKDSLVVLTNLNKKMIECKVSDLLPYSFEEEI